MFKIGLMLLFSIYLCFGMEELRAQQFNKETLLGTWKLESDNDKPLPKDIDIELVVATSTLELRSPEQTVACEWDFSPDNQYIYSSNEKSDEEWKLVTLTDSKLIFIDQGRRLQFKKTAVYQDQEAIDEANPDLKGISIGAAKELYGDWKIVSINQQKNILDLEAYISFRPKGSMYFQVFGSETPATWSLSEDKTQLNIVSFTGNEEKWVIKKFGNKELEIKVGKNLFSCVQIK